MSKRYDIQWLRCLAICAVIAFHLWPDCFPYGYLGVDVFFVISGYLMTSILTKTKNSSYLEFYQRRIKRIFPTCMLIIATCLLVGYGLLTFSHYIFLVYEALWSIFFINNMSTILHKQQYFEIVSDFKFLLHTWSLGVEIQFYVIAPALITTIFSRKNPLTWILGIIGFSSVVQLIVPTEEIAFGLVFCRIWQFLVGTAAFYFSIPPRVEGKVYQLLNEETNQEKDGVATVDSNMSYKVAYLALILMSLNPVNLKTVPLSSIILRLGSTFLCGFIIQMGSTKTLNLPSKVNTLLVYIGDASYSLYLVHWPIIIFFRYFGVLDRYGSLFTLAIIIIVSIFIHEYFEKQLANLSWNINFSLIALFYGIILCMSLFLLAPPEVPTSADDAEITDPVVANEKTAELCKNNGRYFEGCEKDPLMEKYITKRPENYKLTNYCSFKLNSTRNTTVAILGNSFVFYQTYGILSAIKESSIDASKVYVGAVAACNDLASYITQFPKCNALNGSYDQFLPAAKPDVIIFTGRIDHLEVMLKPLPLGRELLEDPGFQSIHKMIQTFSQNTKKLILIEPTPTLINHKTFTPLTAAQAVISGKPLEALTSSLEDYDSLRNAWRRVEEAVKLCDNCEIVPTKSIFCNNERGCPLIDGETKLGRYCDWIHITPRESLKLVPGLIKAINSVIL